MINEVVIQNEPNTPKEESVVSAKKRRKKISALGTFNLSKMMIKAALLGKHLFIRDEVRPIISNEEAHQAQKLLYTEYRKKSLCRENRSALHYNIYTFLPTTTTFISKNKDKVVGTIMYTEDGSLGLPADVLYKTELNEMRKQGNVLVEVGSLALDNSRFGAKTHSLKSLKKITSMLSLFSGLINELYQNTKASHIVIMVNPRHVPIYNFYGFTQFSEIRHYSTVGKPAVPMILDIEKFFSSADTNICSLFAQSTMKVLSRIKKYKYQAEDIATRAWSNPAFFSQLSAQENEILICLFPELKALLEHKKSVSRPTKILSESWVAQIL